MKRFFNEKFSSERALYAEKGVVLSACVFAGEEDGESALKESENVELINCKMQLRYPLWHVKNATLTGCEQTETCRAALWYCKDVKIDKCVLGGIKALRECSNVNINLSTVNSAEFGWKCSCVEVRDSKVNGEYAFFQSENVTFNNVEFGGKYSFQYCKNLTIKNSILNTKDAFWHADNVRVENCTVKGEYLAWYSNNVTFVNCKIIGTQPLCYCNNLTLINCTMEDADLAFEYSDVKADIKGEILSVKNVKSGEIVADKIGEIIAENSVYPLEAKIAIRK